MSAYYNDVHISTFDANATQELLNDLDLHMKNDTDIEKMIYNEDNKTLPKYLLTDRRGRKLCMGTYAKCDRAWAKLLDHVHYSEAGVIWFIHAGQANRMPGY
jgi:hypothetical protein